MRLKVLCMVAALLLVTACGTTQDGSNAGAGTGGASTSSIAPGSQQDFVVNVGDRVFFAFDRSDLSPEARATLDRQAAWLKTYGNTRAVIEGHCDERGTREYNLALGERRASAARRYLIAQGVPASRITTISYGKERPAVLGNNEAAWAQNRRAVTVVSGAPAS